MSVRRGPPGRPLGQPNRLAQVLRAGVNAGAPGRAAPTDAPEYFGLDENSSGKLEEYLSDDDLDRLRAVNKESRKDTGTLGLAAWRRDDNGNARLSHGEWDNYSWTASFTRGRDATGTRLQYAATMDDSVIRGNMGGVEMRIPFRIVNEYIEFDKMADEDFPFAHGSAILNIPEWNLSGKYYFDYGSQDVRYISDVITTASGSRAFHIRIRQTIESEDPRVHVSFGFICRVIENEGGGGGGSEDDEDDEDGGGEDDEDDEIEYTVHTANWYLGSITVYRDD